MADVVHGRIGSIRSTIRLTSVRIRHGGLAVAGTLLTPGAPQGAGRVALTLEWSAKKTFGRGGTTRTLRLGVRGGRFATRLARPRPGFWRVIAHYSGSRDYQPSMSQHVTVAVGLSRS
jgi:hypothetical protein